MNAEYLNDLRPGDMVTIDIGKWKGTKALVKSVHPKTKSLLVQPRKLDEIATNLHKFFVRLGIADVTREFLEIEA